ncbi:MAG: hypothetical protein PHS34_09425 [Candidatus Omnitrophica bacterium]|nr:hypothetical protein [Candidatus Omnitrophota bacterium]
MLYYTPPKDEIFEEVRQVAMELWKEVDVDNDKYGYATEKINRIKDIKNVEDNFMYIVAMFDINNQAKLTNKLSEQARTEIRNRMIEGGNPPEYINF